MPRTVLITGAAGFIGSHVADGFVAAGDRVVVLDDLSSGRRDQVPENARFIEADIRSVEAAEAIRSERPEILVHHAAQMDVRRSTEDPAYDADVNILGTLNLVRAGLESGLRQVIFASTGGAIYGEQENFPADESHPTFPVSPYGISKLAGEHYLRYFHAENGLDVTCLRYGNVYGERQNPHGEAGVVAIFLSRLLAGESCRINGDGLQTRDYVHVSDVVAANLAVAGASGHRVYNVGTGVETTVVDLYEGLAAALGIQKKAEHGPAKPGEQRRSVIDGSKLRAEFDLEQPLSLRDGFSRTATWFRTQT